MDRIRPLIDRLNAGRDVDLAELSPEDLARFDERVRSRLTGVVWEGISGPLATMSPDGYARQAALEALTLTPLHVRLIVLRCVDWVAPVREAALTRLDEVPNELLVEALPLADQLARWRRRGGLLHALLDARLSDDDLRGAAGSADVRTRRAAWGRLEARGALTAADRRRAADDVEPFVRAIAARAPDRDLARRLVDDPAGVVGVRALNALLAFDGADAVTRGLTARSAAVRRTARDHARVRGIDARAVYLARGPDDRIALISLAEMADRRDLERFRAMLDDPRSRVRMAGLRALAQHDRPAARVRAVADLRAGRNVWAAAAVLREGGLDGGEIAALEEVARDHSRSGAQRLRALSLLRRIGQRHLLILLEVWRDEPDGELRDVLLAQADGWLRLGYPGRGRLAGADRARLDELITALNPETRRLLAFYLK